MITVGEYLRTLSKRAHAAYALLLILGIGTIDYYTGSEISLSILYLLPIYLISWYVGLVGGIAASLASALTWLAVELLTDKTYSFKLVPYWNAVVRLGFFGIIVFLQDTLKNEQLQARIDPLTRLGNRRQFFERANAELDRAKRFNHPLTVGYIDLDNFKTVNDTQGHKAGDALLKIVAKTFQSNTRSTDSVARLGGDEFAIILPDTKTEGARIFFTRLNNLLREKMKEETWPVTFSIGIATFVSPPGSVDEMVNKVDALMYAAKESGKNSIRQELYGQKFSQT